MTLTLLLPWFPIILAVGVGARLVGRVRGLSLGILCALFWVVLVQFSAGVGIWGDGWAVTSILAGGVAIAAMGRWAGAEPALRTPAGPTARAEPVSGGPDQGGAIEESFAQVCSAIDSFDDWLERHRSDRDPWIEFDEFVRKLLYQSVQATHVRPFRIQGEDQQLVPLRDLDQIEGAVRLEARRGIVGHVVTTGRAYVAGDATHGDLVEKLAAESSGRIDWCFAIRQGTARLGAVLVGQLDIAPERNRPLLRTMEKLVNRFWCTLADSIRHRRSVQIDPVSGLCTRSAFLAAAEEALHESYRHGEPVAVAVIALEGLREINDTGQWDLADEFVGEVCNVLRRKVRLDDRSGRLDGSRFVLLLRRVDSELASLIVAQLMSRLETLCGDEARWGVKLSARCGVAGSGTEQPDLKTLVSRALIQGRRARLEDLSVCSDLRSLSVAHGATT